MALNKADALTAEELREQTARLKRAAKKTPLVVSAATGAGVPEVVRALRQAIDGARHEAAKPAAARVAAVTPSARAPAHVLVGKSVPTFPGHALNNAAACQGVAPLVVQRACP